MWTEQTISGFKSESVKDAYTRSLKINASILIKSNIHYTRIAEYQIENTVIIKLHTYKLIIIAVYLRPNSSDINESILCNIQDFLDDMTIKQPENSILLAGDMNRMDETLNNTIGTHLTKISFPERINHIYQANGTQVEKELTMAYSNVNQSPLVGYRASLQLSGHCLMHSNIIAAIKPIIRISIPSKKTASLLHDQLSSNLTWTDITNDYPSYAQRIKRICIKTESMDNFKDKRLSKLEVLLRLEITPEQITKHFRDEYKEAVTNAIDQINTSASKKSWKKFGSIASNLFRSKAGVVNLLETPEGHLYHGDELNQILAEKYSQIVQGNSEPVDNHVTFPDNINITTDEIQDILHNLPMNKALASDCIPDAYFNICCTETPFICQSDMAKNTRASHIFEKSFWTDERIKLHLSGRPIPLNKQHPAPATIDKIRFIVALSPIQKILESILARDLQAYMAENLTSTQVGFIKGLNTHQNIKKLIDCKQSHPYVLFVDFETAFDKVDRNLLYDILTTKQVVSQTKIQLVRFIHANGHVDFGRHSVYATLGVPQGSIISPALFNIFVSSLIDKLSQIGRTLAYADDISQASNTMAGIRQAIAITEDWCAESNMTINKSKSAIFSRSRTQTDINGIPCRSEYRYLGILLTARRSMTTYIKQLRLECYKAAWRLKRITKNSSLKMAITLLKLLIHSKIEYGLKTNKNQAELQKIKRQTTRISLGQASNTKNEIIEELLKTKKTGRLQKKKTIDIIKTFNRGSCVSHQRRISSRHLEEHEIKIKYQDIIQAIQTGNKNRIYKICCMLKKVSC